VAEPALDITGLVLAGGRGRRMGGADKGLILFDGVPLAQRAIRRLAPQVATVFVSANRNQARYREFGCPVLHDVSLDAADVAEAPYLGPLAGWLAGLRACTTTWLACVPCDAPHFPLDLVARLCAQAGAARAAVVCCERMEPMFCLLHVSLRSQVEQALAKGQRKSENFLHRVAAQPVAFADAGAFVNLNRAEDLLRHGDPRFSTDFSTNSGAQLR
jgi:molybdenum cofactor guanylyltransferase